MTTILVTTGCLAAYVGACWLLFVKLWPDSPKASKRPITDSSAFSWPESVFDKKEGK